jgi:hypothetical protein
MHRGNRRASSYLIDGVLTFDHTVHRAGLHDLKMTLYKHATNVDTQAALGDGCYANTKQHGKIVRKAPSTDPNASHTRTKETGYFLQTPTNAITPQLRTLPRRHGQASSGACTNPQETFSSPSASFPPAPPFQHLLHPHLSAAEKPAIHNECSRGCSHPPSSQG